MKIGLVSPCIALIVLLFSTSLSAEVFRWVDENGKVHFGDRPPMGQKTETLDLPKGPDQSQAPLVSDEERKLRQRKLVKMLEEGSYGPLGLYFLLSNTGALVGCYIGFSIAKKMVTSL